MTRDVGVGELVNELEQRGDRLPFEIGAFVALEACEGLLQDSVKLEPNDVRVTLDGAVVVAPSAEAAEPDEAARSLVSVLARLLVAAGPGVPPYLLELVKEQATGASERGLRALHDAIEASLIPINRGASRRVLARLVRESDRPPAPPPEVPEVSSSELEAELDDLLRDPVLRTPEADPEPAREPEPARVPEPDPEPARAHVPEPEPVPEAEPEPVTERVRIPRGVREEPAEPTPVAEPLAAAAAPALEEPPRQIIEPVTATIRKWQPAEEPETHTATAAAPFATATESVFGGGAVATGESIPSPEPVPERPSRATAPPSEAEPAYDRPSLPQQLPQRRGGWGVWLFAAALGLGGYAAFATGALDSVLAPTAPAVAPAVPGTIDVAVTPADAQIFIFIGRGPAVAEHLAVAAGHEFVVFDQGLAPSRAIVPEGSTWTTTEGGPLYELAVQARPTDASDTAADLGAPETTPSSTNDAATGTVRVITNPPAAKVYRFVGIGPSVRISVPSIHEGQEVLVFREGHETRRAVIGPSDWQSAGAQGERGASLAVQLPALPAASNVPEPSQD